MIGKLAELNSWSEITNKISKIDFTSLDTCICSNLCWGYLQSEGTL